MRGALQRRAAFNSNRRIPRAVVAVSTRALRAAAGEKKGMDSSISGATVVTSINTNTGIVVLNLVQQGTGSWNRIGRKILLKSLRLKGWAIFTSEPGASGAVVSNSVRFVVVWDKQPNSGTIPTFDTIFGITTQTGTETVTNILNPPRYDNMDRFRILKDWTIDWNPTGFSGTGTNPELAGRTAFDEYLKLNNIETLFSNTSNPSTIADISTGALYLVMRAANASAEANVEIDGMARLRYTD